ncbi:MAG: CoA transferase [Rhodocyclaceae bacterium]|nr:CoA transferase [Rhodocyclaceae bacterium]MCA3026788.1 CoA transferase [Rhodocyclaceae bacterium]MCA3032242.1 CoA transferase [Rhodocyclaceae bacterium]MCA3046924.1 CoA transferase [Rhodocyclaceae bacterium]MCA3049310.1 CoA transferase [Rhodocyclaceae bacterium]
MKLSGIRVIDLSLFLPGPHLTMLMADHGAEVIKLEPPGEGEPVRHVGASQAGHTVWFRNTHRGKKSVSLDLKDAAQKEALLKLIDTADVVVEGFRPGTVDRLGIDYATVSKRNPRIVYCSISAFGQTGPKRLKPAHDLAIQADSGVVSLNLGRDGKPTHPNMPVADMAGSLMALSGILMALLRREKTGQGDYLDISMQDSLLSWTPNVMGIPFAENKAPDVQQQRSFGGGSFYNLYETADRKWLALGGSEHKFVKNLLTALGRPDLIAPGSTPPGPSHEPVKAFLCDTFATKTLADWTVFLDGVDVCWSPVRNLYEATQEPHLAARGTIYIDADGAKHLNNPMKFTNEPAQPDWRLPGVGEHNKDYTGDKSC